MGVSLHELTLLAHAVNKAEGRELGKCMTLGRQKLVLSPVPFTAVANSTGTVTVTGYTKDNVKVDKDGEWTFKMKGRLNRYVRGDYCEKLLCEEFGAETVHSIDYSSFEGATHIADLSKPLNSIEQYDTIIDFGTTEHIFDVSQVFKNISVITRVGGVILHALPTNNYCGHGFYQFSPELFFSLYSETNGFSQTEVFVADYTQQKFWVKIDAPSAGRRIKIRPSEGGMGVLVRTVKTNVIKSMSVYQSDYVDRWTTSKSKETSKQPSSTLRKKIVDTIKQFPIVYSIAKKIYQSLLLKRKPHDEDSVDQMRKIPVAKIWSEWSAANKRLIKSGSNG